MATLLSKETIVGNYAGTSSKAYKFKLEVIENSTDTSANTSNVTMNFYGACYSSSWGFSQFSTPRATTSYDGTQKSSSTVSSITSTSYKLLTTWTGNIEHSSDGTKSISVSGAFAANTSSYNYLPANATITGTVALTTIPRATTVKAKTFTIGTEGTLSYTPASSSFTHALYISLGSLSGYVNSDGTGLSNSVVKHSGNSISFTPPSSFYQQLGANYTYKTGTLTLYTYSGNTQIGSSSATLTINANRTDCLPVITSSSLIDVNSTTAQLTVGDNTSNIIVKGKSSGKVDLTFITKNYATVGTVIIGGTTITPTQTSASSGTYTYTATATINNIPDSSVSISITDSREYPSETTTISATGGLVDYVQLSCNASFERQSPTSNSVILNYSGNYFNDTFGDENNSLTVSWSYREVGTGTWIVGGVLSPTITDNTFSGNNISLGSNFNYKKSYEFVINYSDKIDSLNTGSSVVTKGQGALEIYQNTLLSNGHELLLNDANDSLKLGSGLLNAIYPIGSIYMSVNSTSPANIFGGTWEQIQDKFLLSAGSTYTNGSTGGSASTSYTPSGTVDGHTLTVDEIPSHRHQYFRQRALSSETIGPDSNTTYASTTANGNTKTEPYTYYTGGGGSHNHGFTGQASSIDTMPPYLTVYMWKRTA